MKVLTVAIALLISGCGSPAKEVSTDGDFEIGRLFTKDGCTVYRFSDAGRYVYFTNCNGSTNWNEICGKNCSRGVGVD
jgi:hypothetical protein